MATLRITYSLAGEERELESLIEELRDGEVSIESVFDENNDSVDYEILAA